MAVGVVILLAGAAVASGDDELTRLQAMWSHGEYGKVLPKLIDYRERTRTRNPQLDYMIATSACRDTVHRQTGAEFFSWILYNYNLSSDNRQIVEAERQRCSVTAAPQALGATGPATLVGVIYHGKAGIEVGAESSGNQQADVVDPIAPGRLAARLFEPKAWEKAQRHVFTVVGEGAEVAHVGHFLLVVPPRPKPAQVVSERAINAPPMNTASPAAANNPPVAVNAPDTNPANVNPGNAYPGVNPAQVNPAGVNAPGVTPSVVQTQGVNTQGTAAGPSSGRSVMIQQRAEATSEVSGLPEVGKNLEKYLEFYQSEYSIKAPPHLITVYFARNVEELRSFAAKIHGIRVAPGTIGYSFPGDQSMAAWASSRAYGTFAHELFHLMVRNSFGDIPPWLDEGIAALYEVSRFEGRRAVGVDNWRGPILREAWTTRPSLRTLVQMNRSAFDMVQGPSDRLAAGKTQAVNHATARYFMLYLQERGKLVPVYSVFMNREVRPDPESQTVRLLETTLGSALDDVDADFSRWFLAQR